MRSLSSNVTEQQFIEKYADVFSGQQQWQDDRHVGRRPVRLER